MPCSARRICPVAAQQSLLSSLRYACGTTMADTLSGNAWRCQAGMCVGYKAHLKHVAATICSVKCFTSAYEQLLSPLQAMTEAAAALACSGDMASSADTNSAWLSRCLLLRHTSDALSELFRPKWDRAWCKKPPLASVLLPPFMLLLSKSKLLLPWQFAVVAGKRRCRS